MIISKEASGKADEIVKEGRVFKPLYKDLLDNMPQDLVQEMARRRLQEIDSGLGQKENKGAALGLEKNHESIRN